MRVFLFGLGYSATALAELLVARGVAVAGTTRDREKCAELRGRKIEAFLVDEAGVPVGAEATACREAVRRASHAINSCPPLRGEASADAGLRLLQSCWQENESPALRWCAYLSSTVVYGDHQGAEVDETSPTVPLHENPNESQTQDGEDGVALAYRRAFNRLTCERLWQEWCASQKVAFACFRLAGIYGPGRNAFIALQNGKARRIVRDGHVTGRIHQDDIATALLAGLELSQSSADSVRGVFNLCDDEPASPSEVIAYAAKALGATPPPAEPWQEAQTSLSAMASSFYQGSRRVRARRTKAVLGWAPRYPSYREGLDALLPAFDKA